ncbi:EAL domain-containing protein [Siculibacillus lacustris]|uniref:EAL domain-containing protein n=1 Tax=Siculibacillus lacustris TaxID=1549641 RepID=A0A4Q9VTI6_9HYPH|nr:GGDEF domain-containing phosphodiesterase [Siculibacillus lacustris]TBW39026.1 EAL domain-containing protein [Siculibacillus lacustris]
MAAALAVAVFVPASYWFGAVHYESERAMFTASLSAVRVAKYVYANPKLWQYQKVRIEELIDLDRIPIPAPHQAVFDAMGRPLVEVGTLPAYPRLVRGAPIEVAGQVVGRVDVSFPLQPLIDRLALIALLSGLTGIVTYGAVRVLPLRALDRALAQLRSANDEITLANTLLQQRTQQLVEAQRIGRLGAWSRRFETQVLEWSDEVFDLLGYEREAFLPTRRAVLDLYVGDGAKRILDAQAEVMRTGRAAAVDVKMRRGDGSVGDFAIILKLLFDERGRTVGLRGTVQDITERKSAEDRLAQLAYHDPLTGLANRALFQRNLDEVLTRCRAGGIPGALLLLDLDRFKDVNDALGHSTGDELLGKIAHLISRLLGPDHFVARLGGDEFAVLIQDDAVLATAEPLARRIIAALSVPMRLSRAEVSVGASIGIALIPEHGTTATDLLRNADLALYRAKEAGRGRCATFDPMMNDEIQHKTTLARDLRCALAGEGGLAVHYQPQIDLATGRVCGFEALARWTHPRLGNVPPIEFIRVAESSHLICDLGTWILREAAGQAKAWLAAGEPACKVSVNVSAAQIWASDFAADVARVLAETGLPPHLLCLELTESLLADHEEGRVLAALQSLKRQGVMLSLDDFGTGYSSLGYLTQLPFDTLKIDRVFIDGIAESSRSRELLRGIVALGHGLGLNLVGEGAEKAEEVAILRDLGCDEVQGFVFARPTIAAEALAYAHRCARAAERGGEGGATADRAGAVPADLAGAATAHGVGEAKPDPTFAESGAGVGSAGRPAAAIGLYKAR